jgi:uncharacterized protein (TIGR00255 family)
MSLQSGDASYSMAVMIRSMTGFARREHAGPFGTLAWELRTVNHRYLEVGLRLPEDFRSIENDFRATIGAQVRRGKLDASLYWRPLIQGPSTLEVNAAVLDQVVASAGAVAAHVAPRLGATAPVNVIELLRWPGVLKEPERDVTPLHAAAHALLGEALAALTASRESEGERIAAMLESRCRSLEEQVATVRARLPEVHTRIRARLEERLGQFTLEPNRERLEQELALALTRMDVDEELDRLTSHVVEARKSLRAGEPAGRRLDFLMQEFNREANTLSSKSQDADTTRAAVEMKVLIEQMREQVQNIE